MYAIVKTASESLGMLSILQDWNIPMTVELMADASAALGIIGRTGLGKLRHIDTSYLWLQQESIKNKLKMNKVPGTKNPADMNTKGLSGDEIAKYVDMLNMRYKEGRADLAPEVNNLIKREKCKRFNSSSSKVTHKVRIKENKQPISQNAQISQTECDCGCKNCWLFCAQNERA